MAQTRRAVAKGRFVLYAVFTLICAEGGAYVAGRVLQTRGAVYVPPRRPDLAAYLAVSNPELGWLVPPMADLDVVDNSGSRVIPAFPDPHVLPCASIYGDSFAWGAEVDAEHAWGNVLSRRAGCRVANYGVGGYGTDQAYLRYRRDTDDRSKVVVLTFLSENILRNLNRLRNLIAPVTRIGFKPRFILNETGDLELVPIYTPKDQADLEATLDDPAARLRHEWFLPGGPAGITRLRFPFLLSVARAARGYKLHAALAGQPVHTEYFEPAHPAHGLQISERIVRAFAREAESRGASTLVAVLPVLPDFEYKKTHRTWPYAPLVDSLTRAGVSTLDVGDLFEAELKDRDPCVLYQTCSGGHFSDEGNRVLAGLVYEWLKTHGRL